MQTRITPNTDDFYPVIYIYYKKEFQLKGTVMQIEKALLNDAYVFQKYIENFTFLLFTILR